MVADHLPRLTFNNNQLSIRDSFPNDQLLSIKTTPWYANIINFLVAGKMP